MAMTEENKRSAVAWIEKLMRFFLYMLVLLLPFAKAGIEISFCFLFLLWILKHWLTDGFKLAPDIFYKPLAIFAYIGIISIFGSHYFKDSLLAFFAKFTEGILFYLFAAEALKQKKDIRIIVGLFIFIAVVVSWDALIQVYFTGFDVFLHRPLDTAKGGASASFNQPNSLGGYMIFPLLLTAGWIFAKWHGEMHLRTADWRVILPVSLFLLFGLVLFLSKAEGAWLGALAGILMVAFFYSKKAFLCVFILSLILFSFSSRKIPADLQLASTSLERVSSGRVGLWKDSLIMIKERPFFGYGLNTYMREFQKYRQIPWEHPTYAHNSYLQMAVEMGIPALVFFFWFLTIIFRKALRFIKNKKYPLLLGLTCGMFAFLVHSFFEHNLYTVQLTTLFWLMLGVLAAEINLISREL